VSMCLTQDDGQPLSLDDIVNALLLSGQRVHYCAENVYEIVTLSDVSNR
jgi:hypothetical protein